jgi:hypothetical protein
MSTSIRGCWTPGTASPAQQPTQVGPGEFDLRDLVAGLTDPAIAAGIALHEPAPGAHGKVPPGPVWQCSLRNDASDRILSDDEWRDIARDLLHRTGIAADGDAGACRWVMVRHADDHIHVAAVLVREDTGKKFFPRNDYLRAREPASPQNKPTDWCRQHQWTAPRYPQQPARKPKRRPGGEWGSRRGSGCVAQYARPPSNPAPPKHSWPVCASRECWSGPATTPTDN